MALELTEKDALRAHLEIELGIDPDDLTSPWQAALASMLSFTLGALLPLLTILLFSPDLRVVVTLVAVGLALAGTGLLSSRVGGAPARPAVLRVVGGGLLAMAITFGSARCWHRHRADPVLPALVRYRVRLPLSFTGSHFVVR